LYLTEIFVTAAAPGPLGEPTAYYYDAPPGSYERRENPRVEQGPQTIIVGAPGPDDPEYWTNLGIDAYIAGDLQRAEASFRSALELNADYHYAKYNLARVLISNESVNEAVALLDELIERDPDDSDAIATRGTAALFLEDYAAAAELFRQVLRVRSGDANNWYNFALTLEYLDRPRDAEVAYREALDLDPGLTAAAAGLARVRRRQV
jgi:tetratricopeptide (TPR) repeat protein